MLVQYIRNKNLSFSSADTLERVGDTLLKPLRLVCGRFITIDTNLQSTQLPSLSKIKRLIASILFILFSPLTIPMCIIGAICVSQSHSYQQEKIKFLYKSSLTQDKEENLTQTIGLCK